jgi:FkbM family methyltransferase
MKIAIITQIRNESKRLKEWIKFHHFFYDVDHFLFYLDNPEDDSEHVLNELKKDYSIDYKFTNPIGEYNGNYCMVATERQRISFKDGFESLRNEFDWIGIFDVDEWIVPNNIENFNFKSVLSGVKENILYLPMYNFQPPFDYSKSICEQNFYRWSCQERKDSEHLTCGKSIIRGKIFLDKNFAVDIHLGPDCYEYRNGVDFTSLNHTYRLHQFQHHLHHVNLKYEIFDDSIKKMFDKMKKSRKIFIDGGARTGELFEIIKNDMPQYSDFEFILYEPHPNHTVFLENLSKEKNCKFVNGAISDRTDIRDFYCAIDFYGDQGSTLCSDKKEKLDLENPIKIQSYDIVEILNEFNSDDYVVLKLDVEGSEYDIIQRLIDTDNLNKVNEYIIEWHDQFYEGKRKPRWYFIDEINKHSSHRDWTY